MVIEQAGPEVLLGVCWPDESHGLAQAQTVRGNQTK